MCKKNLLFTLWHCLYVFVFGHMPAVAVTQYLCWACPIEISFFNDGIECFEINNECIFVIHFPFSIDMPVNSFQSFSIF